MGSNGLYADLILVNGKIITVDDNDNIAEAVAIKMGKIVKVGISKEIEALASEGTTRIDLKGRTVLPGSWAERFNVQGSGLMSPYRLNAKRTSPP